MKTILRVMATTMALGASLTTRATMTSPPGCVTSCYPVDLAGLLEYSVSPESVNADDRSRQTSSPVTDRSP